MRVVVVGLGVQGRKRARIALDDVVATVDPVVEDATYRGLDEVDVTSYDAVLLCVPDGVKPDLIARAIGAGKHVLVEKPLVLRESSAYDEFERHAQRENVFIHTAYNHRFEPHIASAKRLLEERAIGDVYRCNLFYGNGTAQLVKGSAWRDTGAGVIPDLGSHLLDTVDHWFGRDLTDVNLVSAHRYENQSPDHAVLQGDEFSPNVLCEVTLLSWRNSFSADVFGSEGSLHIRSLCKWGDSELILRTRVRPSGRPTEERWIAPEGDSTWALEYRYFVAACQARTPTSLSRDARIAAALERVAGQATGPRP
jgi:predicted dehydrogenase